MKDTERIISPTTICTKHFPKKPIIQTKDKTAYGLMKKALRFEILHTAIPACPPE